jgi:hypothetical protein
MNGEKATRFSTRTTDQLKELQKRIGGVVEAWAKAPPPIAWPAPTPASDGI